MARKLLRRKVAVKAGKKKETSHVSDGEEIAAASEKTPRKKANPKTLAASKKGGGSVEDVLGDGSGVLRATIWRSTSRMRGARQSILREN